jgi:hypothetical protein
MGTVRNQVARVLLGLVFFLVVTPLSIILRLFRFDPLALRPPRSNSTFWSPRTARQGRTTRFTKIF